MYFNVWQSNKDGQWYWRLRSGNNKIIANGEGYRNKADCLRAVDLVKSTNTYTPVKEL